MIYKLVQLFIISSLLVFTFFINYRWNDGIHFIVFRELQNKVHKKFYNVQFLTQIKLILILNNNHFKIYFILINLKTSNLKYSTLMTLTRFVFLLKKIACVLFQSKMARFNLIYLHRTAYDIVFSWVIIIFETLLKNQVATSNAES